MEHVFSDITLEFDMIFSEWIETSTLELVLELLPRGWIDDRDRGERFLDPIWSEMYRQILSRLSLHQNTCWCFETVTV
jgi:hypothetical protein